MTGEARKGASRVADVDAAVLRQLNAGTLEAASLMENLATDMRVLLARVFPELANEAQALDPKTGITKRMNAAAALIHEAYGDSRQDLLAGHTSDLVRGWGAYLVGHLTGLTLAERLAGIAPYADDRHFGVREWAWLALRPHIVREPEDAIGILSGWTGDRSANIRRFSVEAIRPRGVWSAHIPVLKANPAMGLPVLEPLKGDASRYVQDSVANWLNDAWKSAPDWVERLCSEWGSASHGPQTAYIVKRALRNKK